MSNEIIVTPFKESLLAPRGGDPQMAGLTALVRRGRRNT